MQWTRANVSNELRLNMFELTVIVLTGSGYNGHVLFIYLMLYSASTDGPVVTCTSGQKLQSK